MLLRCLKVCPLSHQLQVARLKHEIEQLQEQTEHVNSKIADINESIKHDMAEQKLGEENLIKLAWKKEALQDELTSTTAMCLRQKESQVRCSCV